MQSYGTHIVGGELYYTLLNSSTNEYRITVRVFFDCQDGNPDAIATDNTLVISLWNARTNAYISDFEVNKSSSKRINNDDTYKCVVPPGNICISSALYSKVININPSNDGIIVAWQRCCRNGKIDNIINPGGTGFTAWNVIPPKATVNSSPQIKEIPPIYVCVDAPLSFYQDATDADGDSLAYSFSTPYIGGNNSSRIRPSDLSTFDRPPFKQLFWRNNYSEFNQISGDPSFFIDPVTGQISGTPNKTGEYTLGVSVNEYRNGVLIGTTRRDYQISVINCQFDVLADFRVNGGTAIGGSYTFECGDSVKFTNNSQVKAGLNVVYIWNFGDPTTLADTLRTTSRNIPVSYVYPGNGDYTVTLIVRTPVCEDDYSYKVKIRSTKSFELGADRRFCDDFSTILDTRTPDAVSVTWNNGATGSKIIVQDTGMYIAEVSYGKCSYIDTVSVFREFLPDLKIPRDTLICDKVDFVLDAGRDELFYRWSTTPVKRDRAIQITDTGTYIVTSNGRYCVQRDTVRVWTADKVDFGDVYFCEPVLLELPIEGTEEAEYLWSTGAISRTVELKDSGTYWGQITQRNCMSRDTFTIYQEILPQVTLPRDTLRCEAVPVQLDAGRDGLKYQWSTAAKDTLRNLTIDQDGVYTLTSSGVFCTQTDTVKIWQASKVRFKDQFYCNEFAHTEDLGAADEASYLWYDGTATRSKTFTSRGNYWAEISQRNGQCVSRDSFSIRNSVVRLELGDDQHYCDTVYAELDGGPDGIAYTWSTAESTRGISVTEPGVYSVLVEDSLGCTRLDSVTIKMTISPTLSLPRDTTICVNDPILISGPDGFKYLWSTGATTQQESLGVEGAYSLQITDEYGCFATDTIIISIDPNALPNELYVPNAFTPNMDGLNELFPYQKQVNQAEYFIRIYNRWGEKIFDSADVEGGNWDGTYKGEKVPSGAYIYHMFYRACDGRYRTRKGTVSPLY